MEKRENHAREKSLDSVRKTREASAGARSRPVRIVRRRTLRQHPSRAFSVNKSPPRSVVPRGTNTHSGDLTMPSFPRRLLLGLLLSVSTSMSAAAATPETTAPPATQDAIDRERGAFARFLDSHPEMADDISGDPQILKNPGWVQNRAELQAFFDSHPLVKADP